MNIVGRASSPRAAASATRTSSPAGSTPLGNSTGKRSDADHTNQFGQSGDQPLVGDFNGDGIEELAVYRDGTWYIDSNNNGQIDAEDQVIQLGSPGDTPIVGDFNGDGRAEPGVFHDSTARTARR
jgi:hypothetical protein